MKLTTRSHVLPCFSVSLGRKAVELIVKRSESSVRNPEQNAELGLSLKEKTPSGTEEHKESPILVRSTSAPSSTLDLSDFAAEPTDPAVPMFKVATALVKAFLWKEQVRY